MCLDSFAEGGCFPSPFFSLGLGSCLIVAAVACPGPCAQISSATKLSDVASPDGTPHFLRAWSMVDHPGPRGPADNNQVRSHVGCDRCRVRGCGHMHTAAERNTSLSRAVHPKAGKSRSRSSLPKLQPTSQVAFSACPDVVTVTKHCVLLLYHSLSGYVGSLW